MGPAVEGDEADAVKRKGSASVETLERTKVAHEPLLALTSPFSVDEVNYVHILNKILPPDIRVLAWAPVEPDFDARCVFSKRNHI